MDVGTKKFFDDLEDEDDERDAVIKNDDENEEIGEREGQLAIDVYQTDKAIIIESPIAGVDTDNLDIHITNESVSIRGERRQFEEVKDENYFYQECYWGRFSRSVILPQEVDPDASDAKIKNGVLRIVMPKLLRQKGKKLKVKFD